MKYKSLSLLIIALLSACTLGAQNRKKVGVVLSGGGAKGVAHIGALKVIEEAGIPIDYVVGTSMGALVGGLYSIGYTPQQLDSIVNAQNWKFLLSDTPDPETTLLSEKLKEEQYLLSVPIAGKSAHVSDAGLGVKHIATSHRSNYCQDANFLEDIIDTFHISFLILGD